MSDLNVGSLKAFIEVEGDWERKLDDFDRRMASMGRDTERRLAGVSGSYAKTGVAAEVAGKAVAASAQRMATEVERAEARVTKAQDAQARAWATVVKAQEALDKARDSGKASAERLAAAEGRLERALERSGKAQQNVFAAATQLHTARLQAAVAGKDAGEAMGDGVKRGLVTKIALLGPVAAAAAAPALTYAGTVAGSAFVLGVGAGISGLGLKVAAQSEEVQNEADALATYVTTRMQGIAKPLETTWFQIIGDAKSTFDKLAPALSDAMIDLAPVLSRFSHNASRAVMQFERVIEPMTDAFGSLLDEIGPRLPKITDRMADAMARLAKAVKDNPEAIADLVDGAGTAIAMITDFVGLLTRGYGVIDGFNDRISDMEGFFKGINLMPGSTAISWLKDLVYGAEEVAPAIDPATEATEALARAQKEAADAAAEHARRLEELTSVAYEQISAELALREAVDSSHDAVAEYNDAVKEHGRNSEEASDALRDLEGASLQVAEAARENALAQQAAAGRSRDLVGANMSARDALQAMANTASGPARDAILAQIAVLSQLIAKLNAIPGTYAARVQVTVSQTGRYTGPPAGFMPAFARGGSIRGGEIGRVAEYEPEVLNTGDKSYLLMPPNRGGYITPASQFGNGAVGIGEHARGTAAGNGGVVVLRAGDELTRVMFDLIRKRVRNLGGDVQFALGSK